MEHTSVNIDQLQDLMSAMDITKNASTSAIEGYEAAINSLVTSGKIAGAMVEVLENNINKIKGLTNEFGTYCDGVKQAINNIITSTTEIEQKYTSAYEDLLSQDPTNFIG